MTTPTKRSSVLIWNQDNHDDYKGLLTYERDEQCSASSVIVIAPCSTANDVMNAIHNESSANLGYVEFFEDSLCILKEHAVNQVIYQNSCIVLQRKISASLMLGVTSGTINAVNSAIKFIADVTIGYLNIKLDDDGLNQFELLHHLELTLQNKVDNT